MRNSYVKWNMWMKEDVRLTRKSLGLNPLSVHSTGAACPRPGGGAGRGLL